MNNQDITDIPFEIEYNDETGTFLLEVLHGLNISYQNELQKKKIDINNEKHIIYFYNYNLFVDKVFLLFRFVLGKIMSLEKKTYIVYFIFIHVINQRKYNIIIVRSILHLNHLNIP